MTSLNNNTNTNVTIDMDKLMEKVEHYACSTNDAILVGIAEDYMSPGIVAEDIISIDELKELFQDDAPVVEEDFTVEEKVAFNKYCEESGFDFRFDLPSTEEVIESDLTEEITIPELDGVVELPAVEEVIQSTSEPEFDNFLEQLVESQVEEVVEPVIEQVATSVEQITIPELDDVAPLPAEEEKVTVVKSVEVKPVVRQVAEVSKQVAQIVSEVVVAQPAKTAVAGGRTINIPAIEIATAVKATVTKNTVAPTRHALGDLEIGVTLGVITKVFQDLKLAETTDGEFVELEEVATKDLIKSKIRKSRTAKDNINAVGISLENFTNECYIISNKLGWMIMSFGKVIVIVDNNYLGLDGKMNVVWSGVADIPQMYTDFAKYIIRFNKVGHIPGNTAWK